MILNVIGGLFWLLTYILIILTGFSDGAYGMPMIAFCANIAWEFIFSFVRPHTQPQRAINILWFLLDVFILFQLFYLGQKELLFLSAPVFFITIFIVIGLSFFIILFITDKLNDPFGRYSAFGQNLLMSLLFINLLLSRNTVLGQSLYIGLFKLMGSAIFSYRVYTKMPQSKFLNAMYILTFVCDVVYVILFYKCAVNSGINPWTKFI